MSIAPPIDSIPWPEDWQNCFVKPVGWSDFLQFTLSFRPGFVEGSPQLTDGNIYLQSYYDNTFTPSSYCGNILPSPGLLAYLNEREPVGFATSNNTRLLRWDIRYPMGGLTTGIVYL